MARQSRPVEFWLEQVLLSAHRLQDHLQGYSQERFVADDIAIDAASWCIACIGEACGKVLEVSPGFDADHPLLRIRQAYAARNRYVHGYFDLDADQVWDTASRAVPELADGIRKFLDGR
ncbi:MAG: HepT-like ribonuclease domain-containing protein [Rhizobiaceae bacterium]